MSSLKHHLSVALQFFHDARTVREDMQSFMSWMNSESVRAKVDTRDTDVMMRYLRVCIIL